MGRDKPKIIAADPAGIAEAAAALKAGELVCFPTETVYGLGADARNDRAVAAIFEVKGRPSFNPLIVHLASLAAAAQIAVLDGVALELAQAFWPGPFTLVLPRRPDSGISLLVSAGLDTLAVRVPGHPVAQALLFEFGGPVAAPSANLSGRVSPTRAEHVAGEFDDRVALILDGGPCTAGLESTIVRVGDGLIELLRPGTITPDAIEAVAGLPVCRVSDSANPTPNPNSPGQLKSHYAPHKKISR